MKKFLGIFLRNIYKKNHQFVKQVVYNLLAQVGISKAAELKELERETKNLFGERVAVVKGY